MPRLFKFKVCKSVHHRTIQINHQPDATIFQFIILTFVYSSTRFGRCPAHHQELNDCSGSLWFYLRIVVIVVLCSWSGPLSWYHEHSTQDTVLRTTTTRPPIVSGTLTRDANAVLTVNKCSIQRTHTNWTG